ncbi:prolipoprotein diacylglyceryl transferase [Brevibacterium jeotgali]|uniref:Phosphatidylglycerol--prolipoprotein diacylglyceryl transferase n=1 Tax=Brevibacterium jeotgali TaxID=1262550 RepID=A0A2H1L221_9MICO|nr:prolipoprotein diacylglyceryl transferase [Brevibacterium jeotgali]TWC02926.1 prolipoprotein diacylglyceryl transferase [Brevibacterium jeotgali]SMY10948.1 prolipoprotein diacylglyceryl transferase [Brevibacterium jeotgali]
MTDLLASIPSPAWSGFDIGPLRIHAYALCILVGIVLALWLTNRRWQARGGTEDDLWTLAVWAIPSGIIGGRIYHVFSTPAPYFGPGGDPVAALYIWNGGLGIWGAVALGVLVVLLVCRRHGFRFTSFLDAAAPGLILAQAAGRWGNWFNQELFGAPTDLPWGLEIDRTSPTWPDPSLPADTLFHPTFLYESLWNVVGCFVLLWAGRRFSLWRGQVFFLYLAYYTLGRVWIEALRIDDAEHILGLRLNVWTSIVIFVLGAVLLTVSRRRHGGGEDSAYTDDRPRPEADSTEAGTDPGAPEPAERTDDDGEQPARRGGFGFFGAVTSAISIVPQLTGRTDRESGQDTADTNDAQGMKDSQDSGDSQGTNTQGQNARGQNARGTTEP